MSNTASKFILPDGTEVDLAGGGETINVDAELKDTLNQRHKGARALKTPAPTAI